MLAPLFGEGAGASAAPVGEPAIEFPEPVAVSVAPVGEPEAFEFAPLLTVDPAFDSTELVAWRPGPVVMVVDTFLQRCSSLYALLPFSSFPYNL